MPTDRQFTGQQEMADLSGIYNYNARFYSLKLGRFLSADTVVQVPSDPQQLNRYSYVLKNPINKIDPSGNTTICTSDGECVGQVGDAVPRSSKKIQVKKNNNL
jgi:RHS repeat-associated protein